MRLLLLLLTWPVDFEVGHSDLLSDFFFFFFLGGGGGGGGSLCRVLLIGLSSSTGPITFVAPTF